MNIDYHLDRLATAMLARSTLQANFVKCMLNVGFVDQATKLIVHRLMLADEDFQRASAILNVADLMPK